MSASTEPRDEARARDAAEDRDRPDRWLVAVESVLATVLVTGVLVIILIQVVARVLFDTPLTWPEELAVLCVMWLTFVGAGHAMAKGQHLCVDALTNVLPKRLRIPVEIASDLVVAATSLVVVWYGADFVAQIGDGGSAALNIPLMWFYGSTLVGLTLVCLHSVLNTVTAIRRRESVYQAAPHPDAQEEVTA